MKTLCSVHRGAALILVLWMVAALTMVVASGMSVFRVQIQDASRHLDRMRMDAVANAGIQLTAQHLMQTPSLRFRYHWQRLSFDSRVVFVQVTPASGLVDLNVAQENLLAEIFQRAAQLTPAQSIMMAARIKDWIDVDDEPRPLGGAEAPQYRAAGWPTLPRNSGMEDPMEVLSVLGMTPMVYASIQGFLGLNGRSRIHVLAAPPSLIDLLAGQPGTGMSIQQMPPEQIATFLGSSRLEAFFSNNVAEPERLFRLRAYVVDDQGRFMAKEAWIDLSARPDTLTPWTTLQVDPLKRVVQPPADLPS